MWKPQPAPGLTSRLRPSNAKMAAPLLFASVFGFLGAAAAAGYFLGATYVIFPVLFCIYCMPKILKSVSNQAQQLATAGERDRAFASGRETTFGDLPTPALGIGSPPPPSSRPGPSAPKAESPHPTRAARPVAVSPPGGETTRPTGPQTRANPAPGQVSPAPRRAGPEDPSPSL